MEAMALCLPVVAGDSGGTKDIIENGMNGYLVNAKDIEELSDRINHILNDTYLMLKMKKNAIVTAEMYS